MSELVDVEEGEEAVEDGVERNIAIVVEEKESGEDEQREHPEEQMEIEEEEEEANDDEAEIPKLTSVKSDRFGFILGSEESQRGKRLEEFQRAARREKESTRTKKWIAMEKGWKWFVNWRRGKLRSRIRKGIPDPLRWFAWYRLSGAEVYETKYPKLRLLDNKFVSERTLEEIERDIDRTLPRHEQFLVRGGVGQTALRLLLRRYAALDPEVGYCQGMGFVAALLLTYMIEDHAFYCFFSIMTGPKYNLRDLYGPSMAGPKRVIYVFGELCSIHLPTLWSHMLNEGMHPSMFVTEWVMTLFCRGFSFDLATRVFEIFLNEGFKIIYRVCLALLKNVEEDIMASSFEGIMAILKNISSTVDAPALIELAYTIPLRRLHIVLLEENHAILAAEEGVRARRNE